MLYFFDFLFNNKVSSKNSFSKREFYYKQFLESYQSNYYESLLTAEENHFISSSKIIRPFHLAFGCSANEIIREMGRINYKISHQHKNIHITILFFKRGFYRYWSIAQFHLMNNRLVFVKISIPHHSKKIKTTFSKVLSIQYNEGININNIEDIVITDRMNNKIVYKNFFYPSLLYIGYNIIWQQTEANI